jgi:3',5'-cyclic AMP phosphodiesterase CpdA
MRHLSDLARQSGISFCIAVTLLSFCSTGETTAQQHAASAQSVRAIKPARNPLPAEEASTGVTRFSFIVYGDTRGRKDGVQLQYEHSMVVDSILAMIRRLEKTPYPIRFVLQSGDAVVDGRDPKQWNVSFVDLINRITTEGGVPYFLAPGNHDVTTAPSANDSLRKEGLKNYLDAIAQLIPPDGAPRRLAGYPTYAFGYGNTFALAFDSNIAGDNKQYEWVKAQLDGLNHKRYQNVIVFCHHPAFSSGLHGGATVEPATALMRARYLPLFRQHHVAVVFSGHEHFFEHWVERHQDSLGNKYRMDHVVTGGGGAPLYSYTGEPDLHAYLKANAANKVTLEHLVRPGIQPGDNPYHYVLVRVDGTSLRLEVLGVHWGLGFKPYRSREVDLRDEK